MTKTDSTHSIFHSAKRFFSGTLLSRISGMFRDISMAYVFGAEGGIAAFMLAFRLAHLLRRLFGEGALQSAFIPLFETIRHQDEKRAFTFFKNLSLLMSGVLITLIFIFGGAIGFVDHIHLFSESNQEVLFLTSLMLPSLLFICLFGLNASLLQCEKNYFIPAAAPIAFNLIWIGVVIGIGWFQPDDPISVLAIGVIFACCVQWLVTLPKTLSLLNNRVLSSNEQKQSNEPNDLLKLARPLFLGIIGVGASQINNAVDSIFARYAELAGPAYLWYSIRLQQLPLALFGIAIAGAVLPPLSRAFKSKDWSSYNKYLHFGLMNTLALMIPISALIFCMGDTAVNLVYGRGDFDRSAVYETSRCLWAYGMGLIPMSLVLVLAPACYAQNNYSLPTVASISSLVMNLVLNSVFIFGLGWGAVSVAIATSASAWVNLWIVSRQLRSQQTTLETFTNNKLSIVKLISSGCISASIVIFFRHMSEGLPLNYFIEIPLFVWSRSFGEQLVAFFGEFIIFIFSWLICCLLFGISFLPKIEKNHEKLTMDATI